MADLKWNVKNAISRDVERQHLNKILADIRTAIDVVDGKIQTANNSNVFDAIGKMVEGNKEVGISVTYDAAKKLLDFVIANFTLTLAGDVTGAVTITGLNSATLQTTLDASLVGVEEAPVDNNAYWRRNADWEPAGESLQSLAELRGTGFPALAIDDFEPVWNLRVLVPPAEGINIINPAGEAGDPTFELDDDLEAVEGLTTTGLAARTAASTWATRTLVQPAAGITITNPGGVAGDPTFALANDLAAVEGLGTTGYAVRTAADTWATRTLTAGSGIDITNGSGVAGNTTIAHADTSSVANLTSNNSGVVVIQDIAFTFDTFGHVLTATAGTVDLSGAFDPAGSAAAALAAANAYTDGEIATREPTITAGTTYQFWRGDKTFTNTLSTVGLATSTLMNLAADAGQLASYDFYTGSNLRWAVRKTNDAEGGANAGSNFQIKAYTDAGALLRNSLAIDRASGAWTIIGAVGMTGDLTVTGAASVSTDLSVGDDLTVTDDASVGGDLTVTGTITQGSFALPQLVKQPANVINNNAVADTMQDVTGLSFPVLNGGLYRFRFFIVYSANATTTGSRWSINGPAGVSRYRSEYSLTTTTRTTNDGLTTFDAPAASNATSAATAGNIAIIEGVFAPTADGTVIARFASEVAGAAITATANSHVEYQRIN